MDEVLNKYLIRKTRKQKEAFRGFLKNKFPGIKEDKHRLATNMIYGDIEKSKFIFTAHYDTPAGLPFPNIAFPRSLILNILYQLLIMIPIFIILTIITIILSFFLSSNWVTIIIYLLVILMMYLMLNGKANKNNYNDNTSGVITLLEIIKKTEGNCTCIFFDNEEKGLIGSSSFRRRYNKILKDKIIINIDCVGYGDYILFMPSGVNKEDLDILTKYMNSSKKVLEMSKKGFIYYPSDHKVFNKYIAVAAFKKHKLFGLYLDKIHTKKDLNLDETNIDIVSSILSKFILNIERKNINEKI